MSQKILLLLSLILSLTSSYAQKQSRLDLSLRYIEQNAEVKWGLKEADYKDMVVSHYSHDERIGATYVYFNQAINGLQIKNAVLNLTIDKKGRVIFATSTFINDLKSKLEVGKATVKAEDAVVAAAKHLGVINAEKPIALKKSDNGKITFQNVKYTDNAITAEMKYDASNGKIVPVWEVTMDMTQNSDYWEIRMNALDKSFVSKNNLTVYCNHHKGKYAKHDNCGAEHISLQNENALPLSTAIAGASYNVYALPAESPLHGPQKIVVDPHFPESSPFGWHDTNGIDGPEFTITRGNNVFSYTDLNNDDSPDANIPQPDGGTALTFNFPYNLSIEARDNPNAAQTNLFYMNNMMHDITALYGFDEESGNFQAKNYSGKGLGNDFVLAQAFDGFELTTPTLNNANFSTPPDGNSGRMQMFLWEVASGSVSIDEPEQIKGFITEFSTAAFGNPVPTNSEIPVIGNVAVAQDADINAPTQCCKPVIKDLTGKIALIDRGGCDFSKKVYNAQIKGAIAALICNIAGVNGGTGDEINISMGAGENAAQVTIPSIFMRKSDCDKIRVVLNGNQNVTMTLHEREATGPGFKDGAVDNGIIAHEYAHGISTRLTGGPSNSGCLSNAEQMGEGWSDFFSLVLTVEPGDKGSNTRGIGNFATSASIDGVGIRRFPYSTDMNINPQTFNNIKGQTAPHPIGEVWTDCLWDMYWSLVDKYGYDADWRNLESGNAKAIRLVIQAMKMQGCNPGFIRGRDAILAADSLLCGGDNTYLIWDAFARRGLGYNADGGSENDVNDGIENFDPHPLSVEQLKITKTVASSINAGEHIEITLKAVNHVSSTQSGVLITDELPLGATFDASSSSMPGSVVGNNIQFEIGDMDYKEEVTITYKLNTSPSNVSTELINYDFENGEEWEVTSLKGTSIWFITDFASNTGINSYFTQGEAVDNDHSLTTPVLNVTGSLPALKFWHRFDTQSGVDGGFIQIATEDKNFENWTSIKEGFLRNGYNNVIDYTTFAIPSLFGFSGSTQNVFIDSYLDLSAYKGQNIKVRFRYGSNNMEVSNALLPGWFIDDIGMLDVYKYEGKACITNGDNSKGTCTLPLKTVVTGASVPVKDLGVSDFSINVSPNPANDYIVLSVQSKSSNDSKVIIRALDGKIVSTTNLPLAKDQTTQLTIYTSQLASGMYTVSLQNENGMLTQKVIIQ